MLVAEVGRILDFKYLCELETKGCADGWDVEFEWGDTHDQAPLVSILALLHGIFCWLASPVWIGILPVPPVPPQPHIIVIWMDGHFIPIPSTDSSPFFQRQSPRVHPKPTISTSPHLHLGSHKNGNYGWRKKRLDEDGSEWGKWFQARITIKHQIVALRPSEQQGPALKVSTFLVFYPTPVSRFQDNWNKIFQLPSESKNRQDI